ncbi:MAG: glycerol dehydrogenase [Lacrimispora sp.]|uniref:glycerol dehydrogenase n=1 Tax=Lacrimispora sp. TaxID=2719234 RepID=UPI0039E4644A
MRKIITSPGSYIQGKGELKNLSEHYKKLGQKGAYMIVDKFIYETYHDEIVKSFEDIQMPYQISVFGGECSKKEIEHHGSRLAECDVVIGIGGGKTLDASKAVSYYAHIPVMIVPTAASTDAPCSRLSVIYKENGEFESYLPLTSNPEMVIMDTEVIAKAPVRFLAAGIGDALATYYEAAACEKAGAVSMAGGHVTKAAMALAELCRNTLFEEGLKAKLAVEAKICTQAVENIVEANTYLSGIGFESGGLSASHAVHNGLTVLEECHHMLHGEKVAFGTLTQMVLENRPLEELQKVIRFCKEIGLPTNFKDLGIDQVGDEKLLAAATASCGENDTMGNMPFEVTPEDVLAAMKAADRLGSM